MDIILAIMMFLRALGTAQLADVQEPKQTPVQTFPTDTELVQYDADAGFTDKLYSLMPDDRNYMYSPLSVKTALAMAANGADGNTKNEILTATGIQDLHAFNESMKETIEKYSATDLLKLDISNSIWINTDRASYDFSNEYRDIITKFYNGEVGSVNENTAVPEINGWVKNKTNGRIPSIIGSSEFDTALVNAIYFKAKWEDSFSKSATRADKFTDRDGKESEIDFMNATRKIPYGELDGVRVAELEYMTRGSSANGKEFESIVLENTNVSMFILLSDTDIKNPEEIVSTLTDEHMLKNRKVALSIPKFKIEYNVNLKGALYALGIKTAFSSNADFGKMTNTKDFLGISDVLHKTYIEIDEEGTEAAAVTAIMMAATSMPLPEETIPFKANKPFTFLIRDNVSGETLFIGEYAFAK